MRSAEAMVLRSYVEKYFADIVKLLGVVPSDMLLLFKTSDCLRHLDKILGSSVNTSAGKHCCVPLPYGISLLVMYKGG